MTAESEGQGLLPFEEESQGLRNRSQTMGINSLTWLASYGSRGPQFLDISWRAECLGTHTHGDRKGSQDI